MRRVAERVEALSAEVPSLLLNLRGDLKLRCEQPFYVLIQSCVDVA